MQLEISEEAIAWVKEHGGTAAIDFIRPVA